MNKFFASFSFAVVFMFSLTTPMFASEDANVKKVTAEVSESTAKADEKATTMATDEVAKVSEEASQDKKSEATEATSTTAEAAKVDAAEDAAEKKAEGDDEEPDCE